MRKTYNPYMIEPARELRKKMTPEERRLWYQFLRQHPLRFRRQAPVGRFIADFYSCQAKLAVELDGSQHGTPDGMAYDAERDAYFNSLGIYVMRFKNVEVNRYFHEVCRRIDAYIEVHG